MSAISHNLQAVHHNISVASQAASRKPDEVSLLAVSKTWGADAVLEAARAGQRAFGENYEQEAVTKMAAVKAAQPDLALEWHFIGPIQSNKTRSIAEHFDWVHSVDRERIARRLSEQRPAHLPPLNVCIQVNISGETSKSGVSVTEVPALASVIASLPRLRLRGLMAIPEPENDPKKQRIPFAQMKLLFERLRAQGFGMDTLSMGMTDDLPTAVAEGATIVRVGTAIFGQRKTHER
ncbi:MAG: YggS family pyridoxal phosphate-dependent enzyme [Burkholderiaceae bacterium]|nr:YggS family pyridoxal phosphate-dependent enzyme [Burkholderiaceae bacterium]